MSSLHRSQAYSLHHSPSPHTSLTNTPSASSTQFVSSAYTQISTSNSSLTTPSTASTSKSLSINTQRSKTSSQVGYTKTISKNFNPADFDDSDGEPSSSDEVSPCTQDRQITIPASQPSLVSPPKHQEQIEGEVDEDDLFESDDEAPLDDFGHLQLGAGADEIQDEDDGDELARLLLQAEQRRNRPLAPPTDQALESRGIGVGGEAGGKGGCPSENRVDRRTQAIAYLESIPLTFLTQTHTSLKVLNHREKQATSKSKTKKKAASRKRKKNDGDSTDEYESGGSQDRKKEEVVDGEVGIEMRLKNRSNGVDQIISFPDDPVTFESSGREPAMHRMACLMRIASLLYEAILTNGVTTKRDIYYKDVALFKTQSVVDKLVDDIAATAGLKRQDFHVCATSKGLIAGSTLRVYLRSGEVLTFSATNPSLIPPIERIEKVEAIGEVNWVLIVEKDAVFQTLCAARLVEHERLGPGVIITGKGYPDLATLQLLHLIAETFPFVPFFALVDADPHGLDILSVYTLGSKATKFSKDHEDLALGNRLEWLGVKGSELIRYGVKHDELLQLSDRDVQKAMSMLRARRDLPFSWKRELGHMLHVNRKAEIQILSSGSIVDQDAANHALDKIFRDGDDGGGFHADDGGPGNDSGLVEYIVRGMMRSQVG